MQDRKGRSRQCNLTILIARSMRAFENTEPANKHANNSGTQQGHPRITTIYQMSIFTVPFYTILLSWPGFNFSDNHYMVTFTTPSESALTGTCSSYLSTTNRRSSVWMYIFSTKSTKSLKTNLPVKLSENSNIGLHKRVWVYQRTPLPTSADTINTKINTQNHPDHIFLSKVHQFRVTSSLPFWRIDGQ